MKRARVTGLATGMEAHCEDVPGCAEGRVVCTLREAAPPKRMVHPHAFAEGADDEDATTRAVDALRALLRTAVRA